MKVKEESEKTDLKLNIKRTNIMTSGPINLWQSMGEKWKQCQVSSWASKSSQTVNAVMKLKDACSLEENI